MTPGKPTSILLVGFFVDSAWEMKFFFIFRVELIFYCYICPQIEVEDRLHLENENKSCFILHFAQFALSLHSEECEVWRRLSN